MQNIPTKLIDEEFLQTKFPDIKVETHVSLTSTQDALKLKLDKLNQPVLCLAEQQTSGRGRGLNRKWVSPFATNIYLSYFYFSPKKLQELEGLSLIIGLAIVKTIKELGIEVKIKWPNDIFCHDKKMAGVLIETFNHLEKGSKVIIGIGLNVNMSELENDEISQAWTSLRKETGKIYDRNELVVELLKKLKFNLQQFEKNGLNVFLSSWQQHDYLYGKNITLQLASGQVSGEVKGINAQGHLLLCLKNGEIKSFSSGEARIKK